MSFVTFVAKKNYLGSYSYLICPLISIHNEYYLSNSFSPFSKPPPHAMAYTVYPIPIATYLTQHYLSKFKDVSEI